MAIHRFTLVSYRAGISACEKGGQWQQALWLLGESWKVRLDPEVIIYSGSICVCEQGGKWQQACTLLSMLLGAKLAVVT